MQSKLDSFIEVVHNQWVGVVVGWMIVYFIFPLFQHLAQHWVATISTILFFISSSVRIYTIRRRAEAKRYKKNKRLLYLEKLNNGTWLATDADGTQWICKREPFCNGSGKWFVKLEKWDENMEDFMQKMV